MAVYWVKKIPDGAMGTEDAARYLGVSSSTLGVYASTYQDAPDCYRLATRAHSPRRYLRRDLDAWLLAHPFRGNPPGGRPKPGTRLPARPKVEAAPAPEPIPHWMHKFRSNG